MKLLSFDIRSKEASFPENAKSDKVQGPGINLKLNLELLSPQMRMEVELRKLYVLITRADFYPPFFSVDGCMVFFHVIDDFLGVFGDVRILATAHALCFNSELISIPLRRFIPAAQLLLRKLKREHTLFFTLSSSKW